MKIRLHLLTIIVSCSFSTMLIAQNAIIDSLEQLIDSRHIHDTIKMTALDELGWIYAETDFDKSETIAKKLIALSKKNKHYLQLAKSYNLLGSVYGYQSKDLEIIIGAYNKGLQALENEKNELIRANMLNNMGLDYQNAGINDKAFSLHQEALQIGENEKHTYTIMLCLNNIATIFTKKGELEKAKEYYQKARNYAEVDQDMLMLSYFLNNLGNTFQKEEQLDSALAYYDKSLELKRELSNEIRLIPTLSYIGKIYTKKEQFKRGEAFLDEAYTIAKKHDYNYGLGMSLSIWASNKIDQNNYPAAIGYANKALKALGNSGDLTFQMDCYEVLSKAYEMLGDYKIAMKNYKIYDTLEDSIFQKEKEEFVDELEVKYQVSQKEAENKLLKVDKEIAEKVAKSRTATTLALIALLLLITGGSFLIYRYYKRRNELLAKDLKNKKIIEAQAEQLQLKNEELQELDETKTRFFANISHEYKTPLTLIINPIRKALSRNQLDEEDKFLIQSAEKNSLQLFDLTKQVLELTKFEVNKGNYHPINFNLSQSLKKLYADFDTMAQSRQIDFELNFNGDENLVVYWDYFKFSTIVKNLMTNALKFTSKQGEIIIDAKVEKAKLMLQVKDNGQGIPSNDLPYIFNRYYQSRSNASGFGTTIQEGGTGIGLAICNEYAKVLNGTINVQSELGQGSIFTVVIPVVTNSEATSSLFPTSTKETVIKAIPTPTINDALPHILLVEDNLSMQEYIQYTLKDNYNVHIAPHGKAALDFLAENNFIQLIISDLMMPEMNGYELIQHLKNNPQYAKIPVIMLTALNDTQDKLKALRIGIDDYLTKPFVDEELMVRIDNLLDNYERKTAFIALEATTKSASNDNTDNTFQYSIEEQKWLQQVEQTMLENLNNNNYSIDALAHDMAMSRVQFYRKLKSLTGLTPKKHIDEIRFQKARKILENRSLYTIKAIALKVGFKDEKHFSRNFKKRFGKYPSVYLE